MHAISAILFFLSIYQYHICNINLCGRVILIYAAVLLRQGGEQNWGQKSAMERGTRDHSDGKSKKIEK